jgi:hypothetical protein
MSRWGFPLSCESVVTVGCSERCCDDGAERGFQSLEERVVTELDFLEVELPLVPVGSLLLMGGFGVCLVFGNACSHSIISEDMAGGIG